MPRLRMLLLAGIAVLGGGCSALQAAAPEPLASAPAPSPTAAGSWVQSLAFSGDLAGTMTEIAPPSAARSECTGRSSQRAGAWASAIYGPVGTAVYGVVISVPAYRGPGAYTGPAVMVQVLRADGGEVWKSGPADTVSFSVGADEQSGRLDATLANLVARGRLRVTGAWNCRG